jgi:hypothetical protein
MHFQDFVKWLVILQMDASPLRMIEFMLCYKQAIQKLAFILLFSG